MKKYFDQANNRLVYIGNRADEQYWDRHWVTINLRETVVSTRCFMVVPVTRKYLAPGSKILEGGCGIGDKVWCLRKNGYEVVGVDYASKVVKHVNDTLPELDVRYADVSRLPFASDSFDGYWSLGVVEHFYYGYDEIVNEMARVLRSQGYAFVTIPTMSPVRRYKARKGYYPAYVDSEENRNEFYQFALPQESVIATFQKRGFNLVSHNFVIGTKGLKDEIDLLRKPLQVMFDSRNSIAKLTNKAIGVLTSKVAAHTSLYIFRLSSK